MARCSTGRGLYVADLIRPGMAVMRVIRSTQAHARITGIDFSAVADDPDCIGVLAAADLPDEVGRLPAVDLVADSQPVHHGVLARDVVRYVGEPVAVVLAQNAYVAEDLAERVAVGYEPLPVVLDVQAAVREAAPPPYPGLGSNVVHQTTQRVGDPEGGSPRPRS